jgi:hypothetical protein
LAQLIFSFFTNLSRSFAKQLASAAAYQFSCFSEYTKPLFVSPFWSFWPPKAAADCQTLSFSVSVYKIRLFKNQSQST